MEPMFLTIINMSITSSYVILFVLLARLFLKKSPKIFSYGLWAIVLVRLIFPFSFSSTFRFLRLFKMNTTDHIPLDIGRMDQPQINTGIDAVNKWASQSLPASKLLASMNPMDFMIFTYCILWVVGVGCLLIYGFLSYIRLKIKVSTAMLISDNVFESEKIQSPFVLGIINPKIYLPTQLLEKEYHYILMHEQMA